MDLVVTSGVIATLRKEATLAAPAECCGLLLGCGARIVRALPAANVHPDPDRHFEIDPVTLIAAHKASREGAGRNAGEVVLGYYHSHPNGLARPSATDAAMASGDGRVWAIVAGGSVLADVSFWRDDDAGFERLSTTVVEG